MDPVDGVKMVFEKTVLSLLLLLLLLLFRSSARLLSLVTEAAFRAAKSTHRSPTRTWPDCPT